MTRRVFLTPLSVPNHHQPRRQNYLLTPGSIFQLLHSRTVSIDSYSKYLSSSDFTIVFTLYQPTTFVPTGTETWEGCQSRTCRVRGIIFKSPGQGQSPCDIYRLRFFYSTSWLLHAVRTRRVGLSRGCLCGFASPGHVWCNRQLCGRLLRHERPSEFDSSRAWFHPAAPNENCVYGPRTVGSTNINVGAHGFLLGSILFTFLF